MPPRLDLSFVAVPISTRRARLACVGFARHAGASEVVIEDLELCISEAVANVVRHAYQDGGEPGEVHLTARSDGDELFFVVADDGVGFDADAPGYRPGRGLTLLDRLAEELLVLSPDGAGCSVQLRFVLRR